MILENTSNAVTLGYLKEIDRILKKKGFTRREENESALTTYIWSKAGYEIVISGWLKNRKFGTFRCIFDVWFDGEITNIIDCNELQTDTNRQRGRDFVKFYFYEEQFQDYQSKVSDFIGRIKSL